jgi:uncharacterized protein (DUF2062 family)
MPRKFFRKHLPTQDSIRQHRYFGRFGAWLHHPNLWCLNRRSVAGGVAIGLFSGLIPGPLQMLTAAILAIPLKVNLPVALFTTLYTNPFTIGPLYVAAYYIGRLLVGGDATAPAEAPGLAWSSASLHAYLQWMLSLGKPLAVGLVALALLLAGLGYGGVNVAWRAHVIRAWRRRALRRGRARFPGPARKAQK